MEQPLSVFDKLQQQQKAAAQTAAQSEQTYQNALGQFTQYHQEYADGRRNPVADLIRKPERDQAAEKRYKQAATIGLIGDALGLIGKSYAASKGVQPSQTEGAATYRALGELKKLDDIYRQEGVRYDHNRLLDALRRKEAADQIQQINLSEAGNQRSLTGARLQEANRRLEAYQSAQAKAAQDRAKDDLEWQRTQQRDNFKYKRDIALHNISAAARRNDEFKIAAGNVALVVKNPKTGKMEPIPDGDYAVLLNKALADNPQLQSSLNRSGTQMEYKQVADMAVAGYLNKMGVEVSATPPVVAHVAIQPEAKGLADTTKRYYDSITNVITPILQSKQLTERQRENAMFEVLSKFPREVARGWVETYMNE